MGAWCSILEQTVIFHCVLNNRFHGHCFDITLTPLQVSQIILGMAPGLNPVGPVRIPLSGGPKLRALLRSYICDPADAGGELARARYAELTEHS